MGTIEETEAKRERLRSLVDKEHTAPTEGVNHVAVVSSDREKSARFYHDVLGMPLASVAPNRDEPRSTHINIALGSGTMLSLFDFPNVTAPSRPDRRRIRRQGQAGLRASG